MAVTKPVLTDLIRLGHTLYNAVHSTLGLTGEMCRRKVKLSRKRGFIGGLYGFEWILCIFWYCDIEIMETKGNNNSIIAS